MISKHLFKRLHASSSNQVLSHMRMANFAALNNQAIDAAISNPANQNWSSFFSSVKAEDVAESDHKTVGKLLKAISHASESGDAERHTALYD